MDADTAFSTLAAERRAFADVLETLTPEQWATQSLCKAWTVKDVAVHTMVGPTGSMASFATAMIRSLGSFDRANVVMVRRRADRPTSEVVADLREHAESRFVPPTATWTAPYTDLLLHRLDALVPLGIDADRPAALWPDALDLLVSQRGVRLGFTPGRVPDLVYAATDTSWTHGTGLRVEGPAEVLGLALAGRGARLDELDGPGAPALRAHATRASGGGALGGMFGNN